MGFDSADPERKQTTEYRREMFSEVEREVTMNMFRERAETEQATGRAPTIAQTERAIVAALVARNAHIRRGRMSYYQFYMRNRNDRVGQVPATAAPIPAAVSAPRVRRPPAVTVSLNEVEPPRGRKRLRVDNYWSLDEIEDEFKKIKADLVKTWEEDKKCVPTCPLCIDIAEEPVISQCRHLFCKSCYERYLETCFNKRKKPVCPHCRVEWSRPCDVVMMKKGSTVFDCKKDGGALGVSGEEVQ